MQGSIQGFPQGAHTILALSHEAATLAFQGLQGSWAPAVNTFPSLPGTQTRTSPGIMDSLAACSLLPLRIWSPTVLYNAKIIFLLPMQIMSEPSTLPCLMEKAAPQGRGRPSCSYKAY